MKIDREAARKALREADVIKGVDRYYDGLIDLVVAHVSAAPQASGNPGELPAPAVAVPEGWWLAPNEPDFMMASAFLGLSSWPAPTDLSAATVWGAMRAVAPEPPITAAPVVAVSTSKIRTIIALWADDEGLGLSMGQGEDLAGRVHAALTAALEPPATRPEAEANGWQNITSAPRDGTLVDLWSDGKRLTDFHCDVHGRWTRQEGYPAIWRVLLVEPTHWRPRPGDPA